MKALAAAATSAAGIVLSDGAVSYSTLFASRKARTVPAKIADDLNKQGYNIARRTVAKYREQLRVLPAKMRKKA